MGRQDRHGRARIGTPYSPVLGSVLDGMLRNTPEALRFVELAERDGVAAVLAERDDPFGDDSRGPRSGKPAPANSYPAP